MEDEIFSLIEEEEKRQEEELCLIASENYTSKEVMLATGSVLTNKYAEGYPNRRYYAGNGIIDEIESIAIERAKSLFEMDHANVQPHSGSNANLACFVAFLSPGDKYMGLNLSHGGHLSHGSRVNISGKWFDAVHYSVDRETETIDYDAVMKKAKEEKPKMIIAGFSAYPREVDYGEFREVCDEVGAVLLADISHFAGLVAGKALSRKESYPQQYADVITTTTHKTLRGPRGAVILCRDEYAKKIDKAVFPGLQGGPLEHVIAAKAVCFKEAKSLEFREYAKRTIENAKTLADALMDFGFRLVSGGTDTHLVLMDLRNKGIKGSKAQSILEKAGIIANKNTIPYDPEGPFTTSGLRLGTAALTTRGMGNEEMKTIAGWISELIENKGETAERIKNEVKEICLRFPIYRG